MAWANLPKSSRKPALQAAWRSWLGGLGYAPEGNAMAARAAAAAVVPITPSSPSSSSPSSSSPSRSSPSSPDEAAVEIAYAAVSKEAVARLCDDGFVVLDDVLPADVLAACLDAANALKRSRKTVNVGQEGRDDSIAVLAGDDCTEPRGDRPGRLVAVREDAARGARRAAQAPRGDDGGGDAG